MTTSKNTISQAHDEPPPHLRLAGSADFLAPPPLLELLRKAAHPDVVSFAVGMPATDLLPDAPLAAAYSSVLAGQPENLQYRVSSAELKASIVELMAWRGVEARREQVFLTSGAQQSMDLLVRLLLDPGGRVVLEDTVFDGILMAIRTSRPQLTTIPTNARTGLDLEALEAELAREPRPAFLYVIPEGHNPLGTSLDLPARQRLVQVAARYGVPILEDDAYGFLTYDDTVPPALRALEENWVFYLGSFSKIIAPALRVGWIVLPEELVPKLSALKHGMDLDVTNVSQLALSRYIAEGCLDLQLARMRVECRQRRDAMLRALERCLPSSVSWNRPRSGIYIWVELPAGTDAVELLATALEEERVAFAPGAAFAVGNHRRISRCLRLSFANTSPSLIEEGIERLGRSIRRFTGNNGARPALTHSPAPEHPREPRPV